MSLAKIGLYFSFVFFLYNCNVGRKNMSHGSIESNIMYRENAGMIKPNLFLENRVNNCDSAYVFMKHSIKPGCLKKKSGTEEFYPSTIFNVSIPGESDAFLLRELIIDKQILFPNQRYYVSLDCFKGENFQNVLDVFVEPIYHDKIWQYILMQERERNYFYLEFQGDIRFEIAVVNRKVAKANFLQGIAIE